MARVVVGAELPEIVAAKAPQRAVVAYRASVGEAAGDVGPLLVEIEVHRRWLAAGGPDPQLAIAVPPKAPQHAIVLDAAGVGVADVYRCPLVGQSRLVDDGGAGVAAVAEPAGGSVADAPDRSIGAAHAAVLGADRHLVIHGGAGREWIAHVTGGAGAVEAAFGVAALGRLGAIVEAEGALVDVGAHLAVAAPPIVASAAVAALGPGVGGVGGADGVGIAIGRCARSLVTTIVSARGHRAPGALTSRRATGVVRGFVAAGSDHEHDRQQRPVSS